MNLKINKIDSKKKYYLVYTGVFLFFITLFTAYLKFYGKSNINFASDGMNQHYRALLYYSNYLKEIFKNLITNHRLQVPLWDFTIGEGADIINVLHSDAIGDPITFLSVLVPEKYMPAYYMFNTYIRIYLAGIFFSWLCFYTKKNDYFVVLLGTLIYIFCFWSLQSITFHIYFLTPFMYLPLLILGIEKIVNDDNPCLLTIAVFLASISWLYFFYMEALATAIYGVVRLFVKYGRDFENIIYKLVYILFYAVLGILMASIVLLPMLSAYMSDSRMSISNSVSLFYPLFFYERLLTIFVSNDSPYDLCLGFVSSCLLSLSLVLKEFKKNKTLTILNIIWIVSLLFPLLGKVWNGFSYVSQRWSFVIALPIAYNFVEMWNEYKNNKKYLAGVLVVLFGLTFISAWSRNERVLIPLVLCVLFYVLVTNNVEEKIKRLLVLTLIIVNILYIFQYNLSPRGGNFINDLLTTEQATNLKTLDEAHIMKDYMKDEKSFVRYSGYILTNNSAMTLNNYSTNFYWSITNPSDQLYRSELGIRDHLSWQLNGYDYRGPLETLANVKYYIAPSWFYNILPYGFDKVSEKNDYLIFENKYALPFGYTYKDSLSTDKWHQLNGVEKQEAMFERIVIEDGDTNYNNNNIVNLNYSIKTNGDISVDNGIIDVRNNDAELIIELNGESNKENYLIFDGLEFDDKYNVLENDQTDVQITIETSYGKLSYFAFASKPHRYYYGKNNFVSYLGNDEQPLNQLIIKFSLVGEYSFKDLIINCVDMDAYKDKVDNLSKYYLKNVEFGVNSVKGNISLNEDKYLLLSIPYSKGWSAKVDGEVVDILRANEHYLSLKLPSGNHTIELNYMTPSLKIGIIISVVSFCIFAYILKRKKK